MKKDIARITALVISIICLLSLFSCKKDDKDNGSKETTGSSGTQSRREIKLPYTQEDSLDPYKATSLINQGLMPLLYQSLYKLNSSYKPQPLIAGSFTMNATVLTVEIGAGKSFSDGSAITADDVVYSFNKAKTSAYYGSGLSNVLSAKATDAKTVEFTLGTNDPYALACLDFAIVKSNTSSDDASAAQLSTPPVGSGMYVVGYSGSKVVLQKNTFYDGAAPKQSQMTLVNITDSNAVAHSLVIGNINFLFEDLSSGTYSRINASTLDITLNNLIFLGINKSNSRLSDPEFRKNLAVALNREDVINSGYQGHAIETYTPFNPQWYALKGLKQSIKGADKDAAENYLKKNKISSQIKIIVNSENAFRAAAAQKIAEQLNALGMHAVVSPLPFAQYSAAIASNSYDLYIGEIKLPDDMDLTAVMDTSDASYAYYQQMRDGTITLQDFLDKFNETTPFIPLCYRMGLLAFSREVAVEVKGCENDVYQNAAEWYMNG